MFFLTNNVLLVRWLKSSMETLIIHINLVNFSRIYTVEYENSELKCLTNDGKIFKNGISRSWPFGSSKHKSFYLSLFKKPKGFGSHFLSTDYIYNVSLIRKQSQILYSIRYFLVPLSVSRTIAEVNNIFLAEWLIKPHRKFNFSRNNSGVIGNYTALCLY